MTPLYLLTADVAATVLICPVVCAALPLTWRWAGAVLAIGVVWLLASAFALASMGMDATTVAVSHLVLAAATLAAAGVGHLGRAAFPHPLDAIAVALLA